jgi:hypothetical protein
MDAPFSISVSKMHRGAPTSMACIISVGRQMRFPLIISDLCGAFAPMPDMHSRK